MESIARSLANFDVTKFVLVSIRKIQRGDFDRANRANGRDLDCINASPAVHHDQIVTRADFGNRVVGLFHFPISDTGKAGNSSSSRAADLKLSRWAEPIEIRRS